MICVTGNDFQRRRSLRFHVHGFKTCLSPQLPSWTNRLVIAELQAGRPSPQPPTPLTAISKSKSHYNWWSLSQYVKVWSPLWDLWPVITFCPKIVFWKLLSCLWGGLSDERSGLSVVILSLKFEVTLRLTVSQSVCLGIEHPLGLATRYYFLSECCCLGVAVLFLWGALSDERTGLQFSVQSLNGPSCAEPVTILYCFIWDSPNLEGQVTVCTRVSPRNRVALGIEFTLRRLLQLTGYGGRTLTLHQPGSPGPHIYIAQKQDGPVQSHVTTDGQPLIVLVHNPRCFRGAPFERV
jgi:hypothetical protein